MKDYDTKKIFKKKLNYYLDKSGQSQADLADTLKISRSTFSSWCTGEKMPRMNKIEILAEYFGIRKSDLLEDNEELSINLTGIDKEIYDLFQTLSDSEKKKYLKLLKDIKKLNMEDNDD